jgi:hypothetical protein
MILSVKLPQRLEKAKAALKKLLAEIKPYIFSGLAIEVIQE